jgi:hypothetical protein
MPSLRRSVAKPSSGRSHQTFRRLLLSRCEGELSSANFHCPGKVHLKCGAIAITTAGVLGRLRDPGEAQARSGRRCFGDSGTIDVESTRAERTISARPIGSGSCHEPTFAAYSITSSTRAMSGSGIVRLSALAALRFEGSRNRSRILEADALRGAWLRAGGSACSMIMKMKAPRPTCK